LQNNGGDNLPVGANGAFTFATAVASGGAYSVAVQTQPSNPAQNCTVSNGSGNVGNGNITSVSVVCGAAGGGHNEWTWIGGSSTANQSGIYGTQGIASPNNVPGARSCSFTWTDALGNFWLFGGFGLDSAGTSGLLNDLWMYAADQWTWVRGSNLANQPGNYGTQGSPSASNVPGSRSCGVSWVDKNGNLWLFGGFGSDSVGGENPLNDLWEYRAGEWTWVAGSNVNSQKGVYGTKGIAAANNIPGARFHSQAWVDQTGTAWIFGGSSYDSTGAQGPMNDLWQFSGNGWTWVAGSDTINQTGVYGTKGAAAASNEPGSRNPGAGWTDAAGNLWLFGGSGLDSAGASGDLDDLWMYSAGEWTWITGSNLVNEQANYGSQRVPAASNTPGARGPAAVWLDAAGNLWLFGGSVGGGLNQYWMSDLWKYSGGQWTWVSGPNTTNQPGFYGTRGVPATGNIPGARMETAAWIDKSGKFWLFGGVPATLGNLNDLWEYQP
jgi:hypothetical protein